MAEKDNIPEMRPTFDAIRRTDENNNEYWSSRDLCNAMGYSTNWKFQNVINKAIAVANQKGMKIDDHFNQTVDMVTPIPIPSDTLQSPCQGRLVWLPNL